MTAIGTASMGLDASALRLEASASNVANAQTTGALSGSAPQTFEPLGVAQSALADGGVASRAEPIAAPAIPAYLPDAAYANAQGLVDAPDVDFVRETRNQIVALRSYQANAAVIRAESQTQKALLKTV